MSRLHVETHCFKKEYNAYNKEADTLPFGVGLVW